ncbi:M20/M25/M40 family metallo-hydrolase [Mangrovicella endophytica]|uniref:M20/M25/M40 family metallo-hydrolase n=1 Tax=Mangrovicella endophytica TaxID=2066697 RepID=UPI000C9E7F5B|nr:M20/M25/M40 family metallo-hydrolase [Mangrovicella endophytica]
MQPQSLEFLKTLVATPSPSGSEQAIARVFEDYLAPFFHQFDKDVLGNATAALNPDASMKIMLAGHMDEIGFVVHHIDARGLLYFSPVGGHDSVVPIGQRVWVHGRTRIPGVVGRKAIHVLNPDELQNKPKMSDLWIDIGASSQEEALALVSRGDPLTFQHEFAPLAGDRAVARAFDNKAGLFIVAETLRILAQEGGLNPDVGVYAVATVQEEIGSRGAQAAASRIQPQSAIAIDMGQALDYPGVDPSEYGQLDMGSGPGISQGANTNPVVFTMLREAAELSSARYQISVTPGTSPTDARVLQAADSGIATGLLEVPLRYMHTPSEVISLGDVENCIRILVAYCRSVTAETDFTPR